MKIKNIILKDGDIFSSFKESMIEAQFGYGKMYELVHKQLWRKGRIAYTGEEFTYNNRPVKAIKHYDIKSSYTNPYDRDDFNHLGLNQLFVGQNPYDTYEGDPKDGIYHDTCQIIPKKKYLGLFDENEPKLTGHGEITQTGDTTAIVRYGTLGVQVLDTKYYIYGDGLCVELIPKYSYEQNAGEGEMETITVPATLRVLPLLYTDTGDLVQNRIDFIDDWDKEFELNVIEDGYWYSDVLPFVSLVVGLIIAVLSGNPYILLGTFISDVGVLSGNKNLQILGSLIGIYGIVDEIGTKAIQAEELAAGNSLKVAREISMNSSLESIFGHFISGAGMGNLSSIGSNLYGAYQTSAMPDTQVDDPPPEETNTNIYIFDDSYTTGDSYINKVMQIGQI